MDQARAEGKDIYRREQQRFYEAYWQVATDLQVHPVRQDDKEKRRRRAARKREVEKRREESIHVGRENSI